MPTSEEPLLDWHLDRLDENERSWIEGELRRDAELRAKSDRLGQILQPLDHWVLAPGRPNLADKVLAHCVGDRLSSRSNDRLESLSHRSDRLESPSGGMLSGEAGKHAGSMPTPAPPVKACHPPLPVDNGGHGRLRFVSLRELVAIAASIVLLLTVLIPGVSGLRSRSRRALCASNLESVFRGTSAYQAAFGGSLPFAGCRPGARWLPGGAPNTPYASNSRHLYLLVKGNWGPIPGDFLCPADKAARPMKVDNLAAYDDFACASNVSYDSLNLAGMTPNLKPPMPIAYISDVNPLFVGARFNETVDPNIANSPAHRGKGQTVLTLDGSVRWMTKPVYGPRNDNLWLIGSIRHYSGIETPTSNDDVQLVPGYPATDPLVDRTLRR